MNFYSIRDLRNEPKEIWKSLSEGDEVVLTNNGKPTALMLNIEEGNLDELIAIIRQANVMRAVNNIRINAIKNKINKISLEEIDEEIKSAREVE